MKHETCFEAMLLEQFSGHCLAIKSENLPQSHFIGHAQYTLWPSDPDVKY